MQFIAAPTGGAGIRARFVLQVGLDGGELAFVGCANLYPHVAAGCGAGAFEDIGAAHGYLDRMAALARERGSDRLKVDGRLAAEAAADFHGDDLDARVRDAQHRGCAVSNLEVPLRAAPDSDSAVSLPPRGRGVRLDVPLMHGRGAEGPLHDQVRLGEALLDVAERHFGVAGYVALVVVVQLGRAVRDCFLDIGYGGQHFVLDIDEREGFFGGVRALGGDCGDCLSFVQRLLAGEGVVAQMLQVRGRAGDNHARLIGSVGEVGGCNDGEDFGVRLRLARVDGDDVGVGVRAAKHLAVQHAGQVHVRAVERLAGYFVVAVVPNGARADNIVFFGG